jgi:hypothetical protein
MALFSSAFFSLMRSTSDGKKGQAKDEQEANGQITSKKINAKKNPGLKSECLEGGGAAVSNRIGGSRW